MHVLIPEAKPTRLTIREQRVEAIAQQARDALGIGSHQAYQIAVEELAEVEAQANPNWARST